MAITIGQAVLKLVTDDAGLNAGLKKAESSINSSVDRISKKMGQVGRGLTIGVTAPLVAFTTIAVKHAADTEEALSAVNAVLGESADLVVEFAEKSATSFRLSKQAALEAGLAFGGLFKNVGLATDEVANMTVEMTGLAGDLGSFFNVDAAIALEKLQAGLIGSYEPLRAFNVFLSEAAVKQKAVEMGLYSGTGAITEQAKVLARYQLIMEQTADAQGDAARTSNTFTGQLEELRAEWENLLDVVGVRFLPMLTKLLRVLVNLITKFNNLSPAAQNAIIGLGTFAAAAGPTLTVLSKLGGVVKWIIGLLGIGGVAGAAGGGLAGVLFHLQTVIGVFALDAVAAFTGIGGAAGVAAGAIAVLTAPITLLIGSIALLGVTIKFFGADAVETLEMLGAILVALIERAAFEIEKFFNEGAEGLKQFRINSTRELDGWARDAYDRARAWGSNLVNGIVAGIYSAWSQLMDALRNVGDAISSAVAGYSAQLNSIGFQGGGFAGPNVNTNINNTFNAPVDQNSLDNMNTSLTSFINDFIRSF